MAGGLIGALRVTLGIDTAAFEAGSARARTTAVRDATAIGKAYGGLKTSVSGLMAGISLGALVAVTGRALDYASSLAEVAQQLGVTTKDLQEYRYAASQVGISQDEMDKGLSKLTLTMGKARAGVKEPVAAFKALSDVLGKDILKNAATAGDAIPLIADALSKIKDPAARAAIEVALFGKTGQKLDTLLAQGASGVNALRDAAQSLGLVLSEDQIANADKTADKLSELKKVLEANIAGAVANNADAIYQMVDALTKLAVAAVQADQAMRNARLLSTIDAGNRGTLGKVLGTDIGEVAGAWLKGQDWKQLSDQNEKKLMASRSGRQALLTQTAERYNSSTDKAERARLRARESRIRAAEAGSNRVAERPASTGAGAGAVGGAKKTPSGPKVDPDKQTKRYDEEMARLEDEQLRLQSDLTASTTERSQYAQRRIANDLDAYQTELDDKVKAKEITAAQAKKLLLGKRFNAQLEQDVERQRAQDDTTRQALDTDNERLGLQSDLKRGELSEAKTQADRRRLQMELLDIEYERQRAALKAVLALNSSTQAEKDIAQARLDQLDALKAHDAESARRDTAGPMEAFRDGLHRTAGQIKEDFEQIQVDGIQTLNDGLVDAIMNSKSLGDVFSQVANQIVADLIRIALREAESSIFGGGSGDSGSGESGGGIGGLLRGIGSVFGGSKAPATPGIGDGLRGMATGGIIKIGQRPGIDTNLLSINGMPVARVNTGETLRIDPKDNGRRDVRLMVEASPYFDARVVDVTEPHIAAMGLNAASAGAGLAQQSMARRNRQRLGR